MELDGPMEIGTSGICLLCMTQFSTQRSLPVMERVMMFKSLMEFFDVDLISEFKRRYCPEVKTDMKLESLEVLVHLCSSCDKVAKKAGTLFQKLKDIQLELNRCTRKIDGFMKAGENEERMRNFKEIMSSSELRSGEDQADGNFEITCFLRNALMNKCRLKLEFKDPAPPPPAVCDATTNTPFLLPIISPTPQPQQIQPEESGNLSYLVNNEDNPLTSPASTASTLTNSSITETDVDVTMAEIVVPHEGMEMEENRREIQALVMASMIDPCCPPNLRSGPFRMEQNVFNNEVELCIFSEILKRSLV